MAEKVRYYLEQSVPELEDLKKKGLFDKSEITMIMRRRTDFEHRILGRGSKPKDFLKYSAFEMNLEKLRKKRYTRLSKAGAIDTKPSISDWAGVRRVLFIFDRATRKFPGNLELWAQYLLFAKSKGAVKVIYKVYSRLLQLQPRNVDAWLSAANYEFETNSNAKGARSLFQRGLRFNSDSDNLWISYAQFELVYVSKLLARRRVLGLITDKQQQDDGKEEESQKPTDNTTIDDNELNNDKIEVPETDDFNEKLKHLPEADMNMLGNPDTNPALRGDIALTIFDVCISSIFSKPFEDKAQHDKKYFHLVNRFLTLFDRFDSLDRDHLYLHVLRHLQEVYPNDSRTLVIDITLPIRSVTISSSNLSENLHLSVNKFMAYKAKSIGDSKDVLTKLFVDYVTEKFLNEAPNNEKIEMLLKNIIQKCRSL
ncbi:uncharacterized protein PRCAT00000717001 [Priceomyces carsonii]|uniref:uncharacterized protein n=1 Tax=Priceomyces carsonii TaxID=28549 RepID=UPI002EDBB3B0|nr:unnamed protein product [Priceomyces carsonii]